MKTRFLLTTTVFALVFWSCGDDDEKSKKLSGTWEVAGASGVEWLENPENDGEGTMIDVNDPDVDMIGEIFVIEGSEISFFGDSYEFEYSGGVLTIDLGGDESESFNVEFDGGDSDIMVWTQDEPDEHSDYEEKNPGQFLYYQKTFTLQRQ